MDFRHRDPETGELLPMAVSPRLDDLARMAGRLLRAPVAQIAMVDDDHQWVGGSMGIELSSSPAENSFRTAVIHAPDEVVVVPDTTADPRFREQPQVTGDLHLRFYAGIAIRTADGESVGALCVADREPRAGLEEEEVDSLRALATQAEVLLRLTRRTRELGTERRFLNAVLQNLHEGVVACDADGRITVSNTTARELRAEGTPTGPAFEEWAPNYALFDLDGEQLPVERLPLVRAYRGEVLRDVEFAMILHDGRWRRLLSNGQPIRDDDGRLLGAVITMRDVTEERAAEDALRTRAEHDALTGLYNRPSFEERLRRSLAGRHAEEAADEAAREAAGEAARQKAAREEAARHLGVLFLDLDDFKVVNDTHGHAVGDQLLAVAARRLLGVVKEGDIVARMGGDEFVVLCHEVSPSELDAVRERVEHALRQPFELQSGVRIAPRASVGMAHIEDVDGSATVVELADRDMYRRKQAGGSADQT